MNQVPAENTLARIKDEIRADAALTRKRAGELKVDTSKRPASNLQEPVALRDCFSIDELCQSNYTTFLDKAYQALLRRKPDSAGYAAQLHLLASGRSKIEVLGNLRWSAEGRDIGVRVPWLLPQYLIAKAMQIPVLGYLLEWVFSLCTLPRTIRHQRAIEVYNSARRHEFREQFRTVAQQIEVIRAELHRLDKLEARDSELSASLIQLMDRVRPLEENIERINAQSTELGHDVLSMNHWMASLRKNLSAMEAAELEQQRKSEALFANVALRVMDSDKHRQARIEVWSARLLANLPASANVLDLCSGEDWLKCLRERGLDACGVAHSSEFGNRARTQGRNIIIEAPTAVLARTADHSLHGLTALDVGFLLRRIPAAALLNEVRRVLRGKGWVLFGFGNGAATIADRLDGQPEANVDGHLMMQALLASGFVDVEQIRSADGAICVLGRTEGQA